MKVGELIKELEKFDPELDIIMAMKLTCDSRLGYHNSHAKLPVRKVSLDKYPGPSENKYVLLGQNNY